MISHFRVEQLEDLDLLRRERLPQVAHDDGQLLPVDEPVAVLPMETARYSNDLDVLLRQTLGRLHGFRLPHSLSLTDQMERDEILYPTLYPIMAKNSGKFNIPDPSVSTWWRFVY
jgi:hypothetical protein